MEHVHLTTRQLAVRWAIDAKVLATWRSEGIGPAFLKIGSGRIIYRLSDIEAYESACYVAMPAMVRAIVATADEAPASSAPMQKVEAGNN